MVAGWAVAGWAEDGRGMAAAPSGCWPGYLLGGWVACWVGGPAGLGIWEGLWASFAGCELRPISPWYLRAVRWTDQDGLAAVGAGGEGAGGAAYGRVFSY